MSLIPRTALTVAILANLALLWNAMAQNQIRLEEPVENFRIPKFNAEGYREWHLKADQAIYQNENEILIQDMLVRQFTGDESSEVIGTLETARATYYIDSSQIAGPGSIFAQSDQFELSGSDWIWQANENRLTINKNGKVTIFADIGPILE